MTPNKLSLKTIRFYALLMGIVGTTFPAASQAAMDIEALQRKQETKAQDHGAAEERRAQVMVAEERARVAAAPARADIIAAAQRVRAAVGRGAQPPAR